MASTELPEITKHLDDTFRAAKLGYHNKDLVAEKVIQTVDRKEVFFNGEKTVYVVACVEYDTNCTC